MFGKNEFLGEILVPLKDRVFDDPNPGWWDLQEMVSFVGVRTIQIKVLDEWDFQKNYFNIFHSLVRWKICQKVMS